MPTNKIDVDALLGSIADGVIITDAKGRISEINDKALSILGYNRDEVTGKLFSKVIIAEDFDGNRLSNKERPIAQVFAENKSVIARTYYLRKDGTKVPIGLTISPAVLNEKPIGAVEVFRDISHEIGLERAKDEFVAIASHQLRTPATAVKQYLGLLLEGYAEPLTDGQKLFLERAYESNERQLHIVEEILKITQLDLEKVVIRLKKYDIRQIVEEAVEGLHRNFEAKKQRVIVKNPSTPIIAKVDKDQLRIAIENLLENASNYTRAEKKIIVTTKKIKDKVRIMVKDEGVGIDPADFSRLFQKFSRIPNPLSVQIGGTGLGLYWAAKIVHMHHGYIKVRSKVGEGSAFSIFVPDNL